MSTERADKTRDEMPLKPFALKSALRKSMLRTLRGLSDTELETQSQAVARILFEQRFWKEAKSVGCYLSMSKGELRTDGIVGEILKSGKRLYTPYLPSPSSSTASTSHSPTAPSNSLSPRDDGLQDMRMLRLYSTADLERCPTDKWGILDPGERRRDVYGEGEVREDALDNGAPSLDLILIPGVTFDATCNRLGRGKAYYDRFLSQYTSSRPSPLLIALALTPQILPQGENVPTTEHDFQLDGVISPAGLIWRAGPRRD